MMTEPSDNLKRKVREKLEQLEMQQGQDDVWNSICDNCQEPLGNLEAWVYLTARHEDYPERVYYCTRCITIDQSRTIPQ
jgi:hypothetical protein